jgi:hypothetical protein
MNRTRSFPERISDMKDNQLIITTESLQQFREKDHNRTELLAIIGSTSSLEIINNSNYCNECCKLFIRWGNYILEVGEQEQNEDFYIRQKSYAGFYYFIKWFIRSIVLLFFTTLGSIAGKEIGCEITEHTTCPIKVLDLTSSSPHIISTILGFICGLVSGQWLGRYIWDNLTKNVLICLRKVEKYADESKVFLISISMIIYIIGIISFGTIFYFFVDIKHDNIIGAIVGGSIGLVCAVLAYRKNSKCRSGEQTPMIQSFSQDDPPELNI